MNGNKHLVSDKLRNGMKRKAISNIKNYALMCDAKIEQLEKELAASHSHVEYLNKVIVDLKVSAAVFEGGVARKQEEVKYEVHDELVAQLFKAKA